MAFFLFKLENVEKNGLLFSSCEIVNYFSVKNELLPLGERHLAHLPLLILDKRRSYHASAAETEDKIEIYIINRRHFAIEGGCQIIFQEGQRKIYSISQEWLQGAEYSSALGNLAFPKNDFSFTGHYSSGSY